MQAKRTCSTCGEVKPEDAFYVKRRRGRVERDYECKDCAKRRLGRLERRPRTSEQMHEEHIRRVFGLTAQNYADLLHMQGGGCALCGARMCGDGRRLHVDHCHETGQVRGLLCALCNRNIGLYGDDPARLLAAAAYLEHPPARYTVAPRPGLAPTTTLF